jgi:SpoVK/Ycf46/Vps4 family AAA+-type ATPase
LQGEIVKKRQMSMVTTNSTNNNNNMMSANKAKCSVPNFVFTGSPGVGKTMMGQLFAETLFELGLVRSPTYRLATATDLIGRYVGHTERNTEDLLRACKGGVVFIDEAYQFVCGGESHYGRDALNVIMKYADPAMPDRPVIILAGYEYEISVLMKHNPGYESRFPEDGRFKFDNYTRDELVQIGVSKMENYDKMQWTISPDVAVALRTTFDRHYAKFEKGNARVVTEFVRAVMSEQRARVFSQSLMDERMFQVVRVDVEQAAKRFFK